MSKVKLKKQILVYMEQVDDGLLKIIHQLLEREIGFQEYQLTRKQRKEIERRAQEMKSGKVRGIPHNEVIKNLRLTLKKSKSKL